MLNNGDLKKKGGGASVHSLMEEPLAQIGSFEIIIQGVKTEVTQIQRAGSCITQTKQRLLRSLLQEAMQSSLLPITHCIVIGGSLLGTVCLLVDIYNDWRHF